MKIAILVFVITLLVLYVAEAGEDFSDIPLETTGRNPKMIETIRKLTGSSPISEENYKMHRKILINKFNDSIDSITRLADIHYSKGVGEENFRNRIDELDYEKKEYVRYLNEENDDFIATHTYMVKRFLIYVEHHMKLEGKILDNIRTHIKSVNSVGSSQWAYSYPIRRE